MEMEKLLPQKFSAGDPLECVGGPLDGEMTTLSAVLKKKFKSGVYDIGDFISKKTGEVTPVLLWIWF